MTYAKPLPVPDSESQVFWDGCRARKLLIQRCASTGRFQFPPTTFCPGAGFERPEWVEASGKGTVFSWIVVRYPVPKDIYADDIPYVVASVTLDEGCRMATNVVDCAPEDITAGMRVQVRFRDVTDKISLPVFSPVRD